VVTCCSHLFWPRHTRRVTLSGNRGDFIFFQNLNLAQHPLERDTHNQLTAVPSELRESGDVGRSNDVGRSCSNAAATSQASLDFGHGNSGTTDDSSIDDGAATENGGDEIDWFAPVGEPFAPASGGDSDNVGSVGGGRVGGGSAVMVSEFIEFDGAARDSAPTPCTVDEPDDDDDEQQQQQDVIATAMNSHSGGLSNQRLVVTEFGAEDADEMATPKNSHAGGLSNQRLVVTEIEAEDANETATPKNSHSGGLSNQRLVVTEIGAEDADEHGSAVTMAAAPSSPPRFALDDPTEAHKDGRVRTAEQERDEPTAFSEAAGREHEVHGGHDNHADHAADLDETTSTLTHEHAERSEALLTTAACETETLDALIVDFGSPHREIVTPGLMHDFEEQEKIAFN
jgi:hypothetical protein